MKYLIIGLILFFGIITITGLHISTGAGNQVGYVSAVEKNGLIWKTGRVFIKPTLESTQEDVYCVIDDNVYSQLSMASLEKNRVKVNHESHIAYGIKNCDGEDGAIISVDILD